MEVDGEPTVAGAAAAGRAGRRVVKRAAVDESQLGEGPALEDGPEYVLTGEEEEDDEETLEEEEVCICATPKRENVSAWLSRV